MEKIMNYYEVLYILNPNSNKEQIAEVMSEVSGFVEKKKHGIVNHDFWGKKQLAYNVKKHKYGNFVLLNTEFNNADFVNEFKVFLNLNKEVMKYMIIKLDEKPSNEPSQEEGSKDEDKTQEEN
jgi:small subunit ribosomal protein S6|tara:strand:- start:107 stop:475 length:369 start_codon:yes stop_codon:yes gene_type:complete